jgi:aminoglycoside 6'-N-acetyltransferase
MARGADPAGGARLLITFRRLRRDDYSLLARWFTAEHVAPWWREAADVAAIEERYGPTIDGADLAEVFVVELDGVAIGLAQWYRVADNPIWRRALAPSGFGEEAGSIDYLIGEAALLGKGLGPQVIEQFLNEVWPRYPEIAAVVTSTSTDNRRSWRALEKAGFRRVWSGEIVSDDPSDEGPSYLYRRER